MVEHLLAKEDVASSSLVTRSSPESFRGWSECAGALAKADRPKIAKLRLAGQLMKSGCLGHSVVINFRAMKTRFLFDCTLAACLLVLNAPARAANEPKDKTPWKITGQLEEACSCDAACPCWFSSKPTKMTCGGGQALFIERGNYGKVRLDGLAVATMGQSPEGQTMMESYGNWNFAYYYIDEKANQEQC